MTQILEAAASGGATNTKIMYKVFLGHSQMKEYLVILVENGLLDYHQKNAEYKTTSKGFQFLNAYNQIDEVMKLEA
jgi:predicted transcriptional regulator